MPASIKDIQLPILSDTEISLAAVGDIMMGTTFPDESGGMLPPDDGASILSEVAPVLSVVDVAFGNLEGPMLDEGKSTKCPPEKTGRCYAFRVPTRYGKHLRDAGFDVMSLANNHALDFGNEGRESSEKVLDSLGIKHSGRVGDVAMLSVKGKTVAVIAFATYPHSYNLNELESATQAVIELSQKADVVVVSFHGGAEGASKQNVPIGKEEFLKENRGDLRTFSRAVIDAGADLVLGHGPHVVRGMEVYNNRLIAYSLGNFATYGSFNLSGPNGLSMILTVRLALDGSFLGGQVYAAKQTKPGGPKLDPSNEVISVLQKLSQEDFGATSVKIDNTGILSAP